MNDDEEENDEEESEDEEQFGDDPMALLMQLVQRKEKSRNASALKENLKQMFNQLNNMEQELESACTSDDLKRAQECVQKGARDFNRGLRGACYGGSLRCAGLMFQRGARDLAGGLFRLCESNKPNFVLAEKLVSKVSLERRNEMGTKFLLLNQRKKGIYVLKTF